MRWETKAAIDRLKKSLDGLSGMIRRLTFIGLVACLLGAASWAGGFEALVHVAKMTVEEAVTKVSFPDPPYVVLCLFFILLAGATKLIQIGIVLFTVRKIKAMAIGSEDPEVEAILTELEQIRRKYAF